MKRVTKAFPEEGGAKLTKTPRKNFLRGDAAFLTKGKWLFLTSILLKNKLSALHRWNTVLAANT